MASGVCHRSIRVTTGDPVGKAEGVSSGPISYAYVDIFVASKRGVRALAVPGLLGSLGSLWRYYVIPANDNNNSSYYSYIKSENYVTSATHRE